MNSPFIQVIFRFIVLVALQVGILNHIQFGGFVNPYLYILFVITLPFDTPGWLLLVLSFILGISIDTFCDSPGIHTSATVFAGFIRPYVLKSILPREGFESGASPGIKTFGFYWFLQYVLVIVIAHHLFLFVVEVFKFGSFHLILWRTFLSVIFSTILILISQYVILRK
jgi:rod shape-determining protein MreD